jgi:hypothetical protein
MKFRFLALLGTSFAIAIAQPAHSAEPATIDCILNGLDAPARQALLMNVRKWVQDKASGFEFDDAIKPRIIAVSENCQSQFGWTQKARTVALEYSLITDSVLVYEAIVQGDGVDVQKVEAVLRRLPPAQLARLAPDVISMKDAEALASALARAKVNIETPDQGHHVGALAGLMASAEAKKTEFAAS